MDGYGKGQHGAGALEHARAPSYSGSVGNGVWGLENRSICRMANKHFRKNAFRIRARGTQIGYSGTSDVKTTPPPPPDIHTQHLSGPLGY